MHKIVRAKFRDYPAIRENLEEIFPCGPSGGFCLRFARAKSGISTPYQSFFMTDLLSYAQSHPELLAGSSAAAPCPLFGQCGGCQFQDIPYDIELKIKQHYLSDLLSEKIPGASACLEVIVPSLKEYGYRASLDVKLVRFRSGEVLIGFSPLGRNRIIPAEACPVAVPEISRFFPQLKEQAVQKITAKHRNANLVVKSGDDGRVLWGGVGRRSLRLRETDYLWTEIDGTRIFFSLDTFFQKNLGILPKVIQTVQGLGVMDRETVFYDLYGGVGLFGIFFARAVRQVVLIEENIYAVRVAQYNRDYHRLANFQIVSGRVEEQGLSFPAGEKNVVMVDPPRAGLTASVIGQLCADVRPQHLIYLSCSPESLCRDLGELCGRGWSVRRVVPFDFFPRTRHLETLAVLSATVTG